MDKPKQWLMEYTYLVYRDELIVTAPTAKAAIHRFWEAYPGATRLVSVRPKGVRHTTKLLARLSYAREKGEAYVMDPGGT